MINGGQKGTKFFYNFRHFCTVYFVIFSLILIKDVLNSRCVDFSRKIIAFFTDIFSKMQSVFQAARPSIGPRTVTVNWRLPVVRKRN